MLRARIRALRDGRLRVGLLRLGARLWPRVDARIRNAIFKVSGSLMTLGQRRLPR